MSVKCIPLIPHFYITKLGYAGVYLFFFLFLPKNIDCGYSLETPRRGGSNVFLQSMFWSENKKIRYTPTYPSFIRGYTFHCHVILITVNHRKICP